MKEITNGEMEKLVLSVRKQCEEAGASPVDVGSLVLSDGSEDHWIFCVQMFGAGLQYVKSFALDPSASSIVITMVDGSSFEAKGIIEFPESAESETKH